MKRLDLHGYVVAVYAIQAYARSALQHQPGRPAVDSIGIDLHKRESQIGIVTDDGELIERRIATSRERFTVRARASAHVLPEASTESE